MARALFATAAGQALVALIAFVAGFQHLAGSSVGEILSVNAFFVVLFSMSALLFLRSARQQAAPPAVR